MAEQHHPRKILQAEEGLMAPRLAFFRTSSLKIDEDFQMTDLILKAFIFSSNPIYDMRLDSPDLQAITMSCLQGFFDDSLSDRLVGINKLLIHPDVPSVEVREN